MPSMSMLTLILTLALQSTMTGFTPDQLWQNWPDERFVQSPAPCLRPADLSSKLQRLADLYPDTIELEEIGRSFQGRPIHMVTLGHGSRTVLLWSQMHGDEPSATPALLDIANFLLSRAGEPEAAAILDDLTLLIIPMLNPDGSQIYERRNQQAIDINRDARALASPEARALKELRDQLEPSVGFNLHDQGIGTRVGNTDRGVARSKKISTFGKPKFEAALNRTSKLRVSVAWRQGCNDLATRRQSLRAMSRMCAGQMHRGCLFPGRMERE